MLDDNMLKLAKMQETLLRVSSDNRQENLKKYKDIVIEIDKQAFSSFLNELDVVNNHNHTLEEELQIFEKIKDNYNQLSELQLNFMRVCELYMDNELKLSDLSQIDIEYIEKRISVISGYLINLKNIENNKKKLQELNDKLISEEKNKIYLNRKLLENEDLLIHNFENAEGRIIVNGQLQYISVISEYKNLGYDFKLLVNDPEGLSELLSQVNKDNIEIEEKLKTVEICYNTNPDLDGKQILNEISNEFFKVRYRLTMLKILDLLSKRLDDYELFKEKREKLLDLVKYRIVCLKNLGERISIDPFARTKIEEQMDSLKFMQDNSKMISKITKEITLLSEHVDEMINQNEEYKIELNEKRNLVINNVGMNDVVGSIVVEEDDDILGTVLIRSKMDNQVVSIIDVPSRINMSIIRQKTNGVIKRVYEMVRKSRESKKNEVFDNSFVVTPELVIVDSSETLDNENVLETSNSLENGHVVSKDDGETTDISYGEVSMVTDDKDNQQNVIPFEYDSSMFETIEPFLQTPLFLDKTEEVDDVSVDNSNQSSTLSLEDVQTLGNANEDDIVDSNNIVNDILDIFWVTQDEKETNKEEDTISFDEQVSALISSDSDNKIKKLVA